MNTWIKLSVVVALCSFGSSVSAATFTNANLNSQPHPKPVSVTANAGTDTGFALEDGNTLKVYRNTVEGVRIWRFEVGEAYWWVTSKGVISGTDTQKAGRYARTDAEAYQVYLSL